MQCTRPCYVNLSQVNTIVPSPSPLTLVDNSSIKAENMTGEYMEHLNSSTLKRKRIEDQVAAPSSSIITRSHAANKSFPAIPSQSTPVILLPPTATPPLKRKRGRPKKQRTETVKPQHHIWRVDRPEMLPEVDSTTLRVPEGVPIPRCMHCGAYSRPNISMAGDTQDTWVSKRSKDQKKRLLTWMRQVLNRNSEQSLSDSENDEQDDSQRQSNLSKSQENTTTTATPRKRGRPKGSGRRRIAASAGGNEPISLCTKAEEETPLTVKTEEEEETAVATTTTTNTAATTTTATTMATTLTSAPTVDADNSKDLKSSNDGDNDDDVRLVVLEIGCGDSLHSIRIEAEMLAQSNKHIRLVRLNPDYIPPHMLPPQQQQQQQQQQQRTGHPHTGIGTGAQAALQRLAQLLRE
eukprot:TRINITY_DN6425_c0_g1_i1.p1 TRINITY_DN6425_c0_g1~~TRINITY_DN6425_c0_g1_i1.p1  ORF type:complete len:407 (-),score=95.56 TRINITY_DN6425_c0_g1_i1:6-1226(-)